MLLSFVLVLDRMCVGEKRKLVIPSDLGYGDRGSPPKIPGKTFMITSPAHSVRVAIAITPPNGGVIARKYLIPLGRDGNMITNTQNKTYLFYCKK